MVPGHLPYGQVMHYHKPIRGMCRAGIITEGKYPLSYLYIGQDLFVMVCGWIVVTAAEHSWPILVRDLNTPLL